MRANRCLVLFLSVALLFTGCSDGVDPGAAKAFRAARGKMTLTVFPPVLRHGDRVEYSAAEAVRLAGALQAEKTAIPRISVAELPLSPDWLGDYQDMWTRSAKELLAYLRHHPIETDYALMTEYLLGTRVVGGVHVYVVSRDGRLAFSRSLGPGETEFSDVSPQGPEDCTTVALTALRQELAGLATPAR